MRGLRLGLSMTGAASAGGGGGDTTAPTLSSPVGTQTGATTATIGATTDENNGTLYGVVTTSNTAPSAAQVKAGQNNGGTSAVFAGSTSVASMGAKTISATGLTESTSYYAHLMHEDSSGNQSTVVSSAQFTTADVTAPTLSSPVGTKTGSTTATIGATTNEANGTMYGVVTTSNTAPTATQVKAGQNNGGTSAVFAGSTAVASTGAKTISATGLTASTTYYAHIMHEDAAGNKSSVSTSASFTTDAAAAWQPSDSSATLVFIASTSSCFTNQAGTTPVSADGDTVQCIKDTAGNRIAFQTGLTYPVYRTNSGKPFVEFGGSGVDLRGTGATSYGLTDASGNSTFGLAFRPLTNNGEERYVSAGHVWARSVSTGGNLSVLANVAAGGTQGDNAGVAVTANTDYRFIAKLSAPRGVELIVNGTTNGANTAGADLVAYTSQQIDSIDVGGNGMRLARMAWFPSVLDSTNTSNLDTWLAAGM